MAGEGGTTVEVTDDTVVDVIVEGEDGLGAGAGEGAPPGGTGGSAADEAAAALLEAQRKTEEERRRATAAEAQIAVERQRVMEAIRLAGRHERDAALAREASANSELQSVTTGAENATRALTAAKAEMKRAYEAGDSDAMVEAQAKIAEATTDLKDAQRRKAELEKRPAAPVREEVTTATAPAGDPFESYLANGGFAPAAQTWLRAHPECAPSWAGGDDAKNAAMMEGHYAARRSNIRANTPEYFAKIESHLSAEGTPLSPPPPPPPRPAPKKPLMASAPPSNEPPAGPGATSKRSVRLNSAQQEVALFSYPAKQGEDDATHRRRAFTIYAQQLVLAQAEGKIGRTTH